MASSRKKKLCRPSRQYERHETFCEPNDVVRREHQLWIVVERFDDERIGLLQCERDKRIKVRATNRLKSGIYCDRSWTTCACKGHASYRRYLLDR